MKKINKEKMMGRVRRLIKEKGLTITTICEACNVIEQKTVYGWLSAKQIPKVPALVTLTGLLGVTLDDVAVYETTNG